MLESHSSLSLYVPHPLIHCDRSNFNSNFYPVSFTSYRVAIWFVKICINTKMIIAWYLQSKYSWQPWTKIKIIEILSLNKKLMFIRLCLNARNTHFLEEAMLFWSPLPVLYYMYVHNTRPCTICMYHVWRHKRRFAFFFEDVKWAHNNFLFI